MSLVVAEVARTPATAGSPNIEVGNGTLSFTPEGALRSVTHGVISVGFGGATPCQAIRFDFGTPLDQGGKGLDPLTRFSAPSNVTEQAQDGCWVIPGVPCGQCGVNGWGSPLP